MSHSPVDPEFHSMLNHSRALTSYALFDFVHTHLAARYEDILFHGDPQSLPTQTFCRKLFRLRHPDETIDDGTYITEKDWLNSVADYLATLPSSG